MPVTPTDNVSRVKRASVRQLKETRLVQLGGKDQGVAVG